MSDTNEDEELEQYLLQVINEPEGSPIGNLEGEPYTPPPESMATLILPDNDFVVNENPSSSEDVTESPSEPEHSSKSSKQVRPVNLQDVKRRKRKSNKEINQLAMQGIGTANKTRKVKRRKANRKFTDTVAEDPVNDDTTNFSTDNETRTENIDNAIKRSNKRDTFQLYNNMENAIVGPDDSYNKVIPGYTCDVRMQDWMTKETTAVERNCVQKSIKNCVDYQRMKRLLGDIKGTSRSAGKTAEQLELKDYEILQLARVETQRYRSLIGKAMNMLVKQASPDFEKKTGEKIVEGGAAKVATKDMDDGRKRKKGEKRHGKPKKQPKEENYKIDKILEEYSDSVKVITDWVLRDENIEYLMPLEDIPTEDRELWALDLDTPLQRQYLLNLQIYARQRDAEFPNEQLEAQMEAELEELKQQVDAEQGPFLLQKRKDIMKKLLHNQFNLSVEEIESKRDTLDAMLGIDYSQQPGVKRMKTIKIQLGDITCSDMYSYGFNLANVGPLASEVTTSGDPKQLATSLFVENMESIAVLYFNRLASLNMKLMTRDVMASGIVPPPIAQSTYPIQTGGKKDSQTCHLSMWPDGLLWRYRSTDGTDITTVNSGKTRTAIRAFMYSDMLDKFLRIQRSKIFQVTDADGTSRPASKIQYLIEQSVANPNRNPVEPDDPEMWDVSDISEIDVHYTGLDELSEHLNFHLNSKRFSGADGDNHRRGMQYTMKTYRELWRTRYRARVDAGLTFYPAIKGEYWYTGERSFWYDIFTGRRSMLDVRVAPSEHTMYTEDWSGYSRNNLGTGMVTRGSFLTVKESIAPHLIKPENVTPDIAGIALYMLLVENTKRGRKNVWFKDRKKLRKGKKSGMTEKEIIRWQGWFPRIFDLESVCEGGLIPEQYRWDKPEWLLLYFKAIASLLYRDGEGTATNYLLTVRLNKLQMFGNVSYRKLIYLLRKYLDFGVCVDASVAGSGTEGSPDYIPSMYPYLEYDYVMFDRRMVYSTVRDIQVIPKEDGTGNINVPNFWMYELEIDPSEVWLVRMMPTTAELWKLLLFCYQDYFSNSFGMRLVRNLFDFVYADVEMDSGDLKPATEEGKKLEDFKDFTKQNLERIRRNIVFPTRNPDPNPSSDPVRTDIDFSGDLELDLGLPSTNIDVTNQLASSPVQQVQLTEEEQPQRGARNVPKRLDTVARKTQNTSVPAQVNAQFKNLTVKRLKGSQAYKNAKVRDERVQARTIDTTAGPRAQLEIPKYVWVQLDANQKQQLADLAEAARFESPDGIVSWNQERLAGVKQVVEGYKSQVEAPVKDGKILYMLDSEVMKYVTPVQVPRSMYDRMTQTQKLRLANHLLVDHRLFNRVVRSTIPAIANAYVWDCTKDPGRADLPALEYREELQKALNDHPPQLVPHHIIERFRTFYTIPSIVWNLLPYDVADRTAVFDSRLQWVPTKADIIELWRMNKTDMFNRPYEINGVKHSSVMESIYMYYIVLVKQAGSEEPVTYQDFLKLGSPTVDIEGRHSYGIDKNGNLLGVQMDRVLPFCTDSVIYPAEGERLPFRPDVALRSRPALYQGQVIEKPATTEEEQLAEFDIYGTQITDYEPEGEDFLTVEELPERLAVLRSVLSESDFQQLMTERVQPSMQPEEYASLVQKLNNVSAFGQYRILNNLGKRNRRIRIEEPGSEVPQASLRSLVERGLDVGDADLQAALEAESADEELENNEVEEAENNEEEENINEQETSIESVQGEQQEIPQAAETSAENLENEQQEFAITPELVENVQQVTPQTSEVEPEYFPIEIQTPQLKSNEYDESQLPDLLGSLEVQQSDLLTNLENEAEQSPLTPPNPESIATQIQAEEGIPEGSLESDEITETPENVERDIYLTDEALDQIINNYNPDEVSK